VGILVYIQKLIEASFLRRALKQSHMGRAVPYLGTEGGPLDLDKCIYYVDPLYPIRYGPVSFFLHPHSIPSLHLKHFFGFYFNFIIIIIIFFKKKESKERYRRIKIFSNYLFEFERIKVGDCEIPLMRPT
jgi:hypothetical protein